MRFTKMHGCGNDYVVVDATSGDLADRFAAAEVAAAGPLAQAMNDRRHGVGADGFVLILPETRPDSDARFEMRMYNPDGSYSAMCGNALRCVAKRLADDGVLTDDAVVVRTAETRVPMRIAGRAASGKVELVEADLGPPVLTPGDIPCRLAGGREGDLRSVSLSVDGGAIDATVLSMGNPHCVLFIDQPTASAPVETLGPKLEHHEAFPDRTNVEFVQVLAPDRMRQRTWERGAGETLACGSGACAVAVAGVLTERTQRRVTIELRGGDLDLEWREADGHVVMTGPAVEVFTGVWPQSA